MRPDIVFTLPSQSADTAYTHTQTTPAAQWSITHTFGRLPVVQVLVDDEVVYADVDYPDASHVLITFASPTAGLAVLT